MPKIFQITQNVNTGEVEVAIDKNRSFVQQLRDVRYNIEQLDPATEGYRQKLGALNLEYQELNEQIKINQVRNKNIFDQLGMLGGEFGETGAKIGEVSLGLNMLSSFRFEDLGTSLKFIGSTTSKIAAGFLELTGITKLYTFSVEGLTKAFIGLGASEEGAAAAAEGFSAAIIATGIGAIIVGLGLLIANWEKVENAISGATEVTKAYDESQKDVTKDVADFDKKLFEVKNSLAAAEAGTKSKKEALKEYNDKLGDTVGYAGSLKQAEDLLAANTEIVVNGIKLRAQAQAMYAKAAEASAKLISGEGLEEGFWKSALGLVTHFGDATGYAADRVAEFTEENKTAAKELEEEGDRLTKLAIENDKKRKAGLEDKPGAVKKAKDNSSELQAIQDYIDKAQALQEGGRQLEIQAEQKQYNKLLAEAIKLGKDTEALREAHRENLQAINNKWDKKDIDALQATYDAYIKDEEKRWKDQEALEIDALENRYAKGLLTEEDYLKQLKAIKVKYALDDQNLLLKADTDYTKGINKLSADRIKQVQEEEKTQKAVAKAIAQSWIDLGSNMATTFGQIANLFEKGSDAAKAFGVISVIINAAASIGKIKFAADEASAGFAKTIAEATATAEYGALLAADPFTAALGAEMIAVATGVGTAASAELAATKGTEALQIASVGITSGAQIAAILSASGTSGASAASAGASGTSTTPSFNGTVTVPAPVIGASSASSTGNLGSIVGNAVQSGNSTSRPIQAFVVGTQVTTQQQLDRRIALAARMGG